MMKNITSSRILRYGFFAGSLLFAHGASAAMVFSENFDDQIAGDAPAGWVVSEPNTNTVQISDTTSVSGPNSLRFDKPETGSFPSAARAFTTQESGVVTVELSGWTSTTNHDSLYIKLQNSSTQDLGGIRFDNNGVFAYMAIDGTWTDSAISYSASTWHDVRLDFDLDNQTYSVLAGAATVVTDAPFRSGASAADAARLLIQDRVFIGAGTSYVDNVSVSAIPEPATVGAGLGVVVLLVAVARRRFGRRA